MATLKEYFNNDFKDLSINRDLNLKINQNDNNDLIISEKVLQNANSSVRFFAYYIPASTNTVEIIMHLLSSGLENSIKSIESNIQILSKFIGDTQVGNNSNMYSNRVFFYTEIQLTDREIATLDELCKSSNLCVTIRSKDYVSKKMELEKPLAFISHDSRDKEIIARPLANGLASRCCTVWYDEYSLKIGDSLRESIEEGIKTAKKCILILTKNYLANPGWGKKEFNSIFTREIICNEKIVIPIWHDVTKNDIYEYSPSLADIFALTWPIPGNKTKDEYDREVQQLISKIHLAITNP